MPKLVWNGGLELDWKTISAFVWAVFVTAGGAWEIRDLQKRLDAHLLEAKPLIDILKSLDTRASIAERRLDICCPYYRPQGPRDLFPERPRTTP